jgi:hypothetical protein
VLFLALFVVSNWGEASYLPFPQHGVEIGYQVLSVALAAAAIVGGARRGWREVEVAGTAFLVLLLLARFFDWWWDWMPRWLFFLVIGVLAVGMLAALRRLRSAAQGRPS